MYDIVLFLHQQGAGRVGTGHVSYNLGEMVVRGGSSEEVSSAMPSGMRCGDKYAGENLTNERLGMCKNYEG